MYYTIFVATICMITYILLNSFIIKPLVFNLLQNNLMTFIFIAFFALFEAVCVVEIIYLMEKNNATVKTL